MRRQNSDKMASIIYFILHIHKYDEEKKNYVCKHFLYTDYFLAEKYTL